MGQRKNMLEAAFESDSKEEKFGDEKTIKVTLKAKTYRKLEKKAGKKKVSRDELAEKLIRKGL